MSTNSILPISPGGRRYGRFPDNPFHPARSLRTLRADKAITLPPRATTSQWMGKIRDQGQEGSCTGQMGAEIRDLLYRKLYEFEKDKTIAPADFQASASFVYKNNLIADGDLGQDAGSSIHQTMISLNRYGACLEGVEPYSDHDFSTAPSSDQYTNGLLYKAGAYHYLPDLQTMKQCIASGYSFGFGITVFESFEGDWNSTGYMPMPQPNEQQLGGHAQHGMDYDDEIKFPDGNVGGILVQNSWSEQWGISAPGRTDRGCYWMPYKFIESGNTSDGWMIHLGHAWK